MSKRDFQKYVKSKEGYIFSDGTHNVVDLLCKTYDLITDFNIKTKLKGEIRKSLGVETNLNATYQHYYNRLNVKADDELISYMWNEEVYYLFNDLAPIGYYFGTSEGDGACFGWFKNEE